MNRVKYCRQARTIPCQETTSPDKAAETHAYKPCQSYLDNPDTRVAIRRQLMGLTVLELASISDSQTSSTNCVAGTSNQRPTSIEQVGKVGRRAHHHSSSRRPCSRHDASCPCSE